MKIPVWLCCALFASGLFLAMPFLPESSRYLLLGLITTLSIGGIVAIVRDI